MDKTPDNSRFKRRLLWGVALIALVLAGGGIWFYKVYFASTDSPCRGIHLSAHDGGTVG